MRMQQLNLDKKTRAEWKRKEETMEDFCSVSHFFSTRNERSNITVNGDNSPFTSPPPPTNPTTMGRDRRKQNNCAQNRRGKLDGRFFFIILDFILSPQDRR